MAANTAHVYKSKSGSWNLSFHHPICRDGSVGKKIHRSLKVTDEAEALALREQINDLLRIAAETPSLLPTRSHALSEQTYARVIVDAFYDCMTPEPVDYAALRNKLMPLPPRAGEMGGVPHALLVGGTGTGKSRLSQHLLQTTRENFPMRGAGRTTVSDTEVIVGDFEFSAAITFFSQNEVRQIVRENLQEACAFAYGRSDDKEKIASKLLVDSNKRFRFSFVLGGWTKKGQAPDEEDEVQGGDQDLDFGPEALAASRWTRLEHCVDQVVAFAAAARERAQADSSEEEQAEENWEQYIEDEVDGLAEEIIGELERRLCAATGQSSWPVTHQIKDTPDKAEFFKQLRVFYQNHRALFGTLVTPLVQGIRVRGKLYAPDWAEGPSSWVLLDGQGVGHEQGTATKINRTVPPELAKKYSGADLILLVDRAMPAMTGDAPIILQDLIVRGFLERLVVVFTHFEAVEAPDLDISGRQEKVLEGLSNAVQSIASLPKRQKVILERTAEERTHFLARLDLREIANKTTQDEVHRLLHRVSASCGEDQAQALRPLYNEYEIAELVRAEIEAYRRDWSTEELSSFHFKIVEALTNWIGNAFSDGYPKQNLYPGQDLSRRLVSAISIKLEHPRDWSPSKPVSEDDESQILNAIRKSVGERIDAYCREVLVHDPRTVSWLPAYQNISGRGTKIRRARTVARILEDHAQLPDEGVGEFAKNIWLIVEGAITEACATNVETQKAAR